MKINYTLPAILLLCCSILPMAPSFADESKNLIHTQPIKPERHRIPNRRQNPSVPVPTEQSNAVKIEQSWGDKVKMELRKAAPAQGYLINNAEWSKLWKTYRGSEEVPNIDFDRKLVLVYVHTDPNSIGITPSLSATGNLTVAHVATQIGYQNPTECSYIFALIDRQGIKTISGQPIANANSR